MEIILRNKLGAEIGWTSILDKVSSAALNNFVPDTFSKRHLFERGYEKIGDWIATEIPDRPTQAELWEAEYAKRPKLLKSMG